METTRVEHDDQAKDGEQVSLPWDTTTPATILVIDDDELICETIGVQLAEAGHMVRRATSGKQGIAMLDQAVDLVLLDWRLPDVDGLQLLRDMCRMQPDTLVVMLTGFASIESAVEAMREGAFHYIAKPVDFEMLLMTVERALKTTQLRHHLEAHRLTRGPLARLVGQSPAMCEVKQLLERVASSPASTVLLTGETGTGKGLAARALHDKSERRQAPFLNITCSALPSTLLESELFGHERGAFTDARTLKKGLIEHANGGTLFLDEISELELAMQSKLLRFLEERRFRRVGGTEDLWANVRVVAATNVDLHQAVKRGTFREDLYYRLAVMLIHLPPLRERRGDPELLASSFVAVFNRELNKKVRGLTNRARKRLEQYSWPGNVRELRNLIERAMLLTEREVLDLVDLPFESKRKVCPLFELPPEGVSLREVERDLLVQALKRTQGNQVRAAALLGMSRDQIRYRIEKFGLQDLK